MAKGYWIARIDIHNMDGYKEYIAQNGAVFAKYGAKFWCAAASTRSRKARPDRAMCAESRTTRRAGLLQFTEYARLVAIRSPHSQGDLVIIEGYDGAQPQ